MPTCLVICPFGPEGSQERERSDDVFNFLIKPVAESKGYETKRLIDEAEPGFISEEMMRRLYRADIVIADITGSNPNVLYELALRHSIAKPFIHMCENTDKIPFDIAMAHVIPINKASLEGVEKAKQDLGIQIEKIENKAVDFSNPASVHRPETECAPAVRAFEWKIRYLPTLAQDWLHLKEPAFQNLVNDYVNDTLTKPVNALQKSDMAEYFAYKNAQGTKLRGDLYYQHDQETDTFSGWGILKFTTSAVNLPIRIEGRMNGNGQITLEFDQPPQRVTIPPDFDEEIRGFNFKIEYTPSMNKKKTLEGILFHPEFVENDKPQLRLALTSLRFRN